ncbi:3-oxoacyl-[acyl-carrier protein] reductase [Evansella caseinilytica]|uniref:3-oxoacyl-[acyl-carrier protein] reductase n=1 Tax=Evansella caseinilytica TaxID=1503961 RepID=A0A1H3V1U4_9BACI|nr:SDR family oxidoreductase [Evansella caseinilytica]SDZ68538.1 3-oxoacyl-[acyl-carrier protein] reductase [Evansella caseinilytica]
MDLQLINKKALITGSTKGIGKAIAFELAKEGVDVLVNGRNNEEVEMIVNDINKKYPETNPQNAFGNLLNKDERENIYHHHPDVDILVNNLGIYEMMTYEEINEDVWKKYIETNFLVADNLSRFYINKMLSKNFGRIIFIASEEAVMPSGNMLQYAVTKSMILSLSKSLSFLTKGKEVTINSIMPGPTLSENVENILKDIYSHSSKSFEQIEKDFVLSHLPDSHIERFIRPFEIGRMVAFVSSPHSGAMKGTAVRMDGGLIPTIY